MSGELPATEGTMMRIVRLGNAWAAATAHAQAVRMTNSVFKTGFCGNCHLLAA
jgi:hypothetical protein